jgi:WASH complex subunit strumpellin
VVFDEERFVRQVLEIVPKEMFLVLQKIIDMQTRELAELPTKLEKEKVKEYV